MRAIILYFCLSFQCLPLLAQSLKIDSVLQQIVACQKKQSDAFYAAGMFPSQRAYYSHKKPVSEDENIFFTGLVVWTLKSLKPNLSDANKAVADSISSRAISNYSRFKNRKGGLTYNFWQTSPSRYFPNHPYFSKRDKYMLPDDLDDTSILYLSGDFEDSLKKQVKTLLPNHANRANRNIRSTYRKYNRVEAYSTWFGKKMPIDFDICVHANALMFVLDNKFDLDRNDSATIQLVVSMVQSGEYVKNASYLSPHYKKPVIVLYHLARLVAAHPEQAGLEKIKSQLVQDLQKQWPLATNAIERILLQNSMLRLGIVSPENIVVQEADLESFYFFVANMTSTLPNPVKRMFVDSKRTNFYYRSRAYYLTLVLENELLKYKVNK